LITTYAYAREGVYSIPCERFLIKTIPGAYQTFEELKFRRIEVLKI